MGDPLKKVQPGQPLRIPAQTFNTFIDAARDYLERRQGAGGDPLAEVRPAGVVLVKNTTGEDRGLFEIVALDGPVYTPADNEEGFKFRWALKGAKPDSDHVGNFAILLEPLKGGAIGRALVQGMTPVKVRVDEGEEGLEYADVCTDEGEECQHLRLTGRGAAQVLWREDGTGEKWALVRVSNVAPAMHEVTIHGLKVTGVWKAWGAAWGGFEADGYITFVSGKFAFLDKSWVDEESDDLFIKVTGPRGKNAPIGYRGIAAGDFIGWVAGDYWEEIPDSGGEVYDGEVVPFVGPEAALPSWEVTAGKGLALEDPVPYDRKLHVELEATKPGLKFDAETDAGRLMVKANEDRGITVTANGVEAKIDDGAKGLRFDASGNIEVEPDGARAIDVTVQGVGVVADTSRGIDVTVDGVRAKTGDAGGLEFDGAGNLAVKPDATKAVSVSAQGVAVEADTDKGLAYGAGGKLEAKPDTARGIDVAADGIRAVLEADKGLEFGAGGGLAVKLDGSGGLEHDPDGLRLKLAPTGSGGSGLDVSVDGVKVAAGRGLEVEDNSVHVDLAEDPGLEFDSSGEDGRLRVKPDTDSGLEVDGSGVKVKIDVGLEFSSGALRAKVNTTCGLQVNSNGIEGKVGTGLKFDNGAFAIDTSGVKSYTGTLCGIKTDGFGRVTHVHNGAGWVPI